MYKIVLQFSLGSCLFFPLHAPWFFVHMIFAQPGDVWEGTCGGIAELCSLFTVCSLCAPPAPVSFHCRTVSFDHLLAAVSPAPPQYLAWSRSSINIC